MTIASVLVQYLTLTMIASALLGILWIIIEVDDPKAVIPTIIAYFLGSAFTAIVISSAIKMMEK